MLRMVPLPRFAEEEHLWVPPPLAGEVASGASRRGRRQRRLRVTVGAAALLRPTLRFGVGAHSDQRAVAYRADAPAQRQIRADRGADYQRNGGHGSTSRG